MILARTLGCTVDELKDRISFSEYLEHLADYLIAPFGQRRDDYRAAYIAAQHANIKYGTKEKPKPFSYKDFLLPLDGPFEESPYYNSPIEEQEQSRRESQLVEQLDSLADLYGWSFKML